MIGKGPRFVTRVYVVLPDDMGDPVVFATMKAAKRYARYAGDRIYVRVIRTCLSPFPLGWRGPRQ